MAIRPNEGAETPVSISVKTGRANIPNTFMVLSVHVSAGLGEIPKAVIALGTPRIASESYDGLDSATFTQGKEIELSAGYDGGREDVIFRGVISGKRLRVASSDVWTEITAYDKAITLNGTRRTSFFEQKKDSDVMSTLLSDAGLGADIAATADENHDHIQYDCTDWDFLRSIADRNGHVLQVENGKITSAPPDAGGAAVLTATLGDSIIDLDLRVDTQNLLSDANSKAWNSTDQKIVEGEASTLPDLQHWGNVSAKTLAEAVASQSLATATSREMPQADLVTLSRARLTRSVLSALQGHCTFPGNHLAVPGAVLELAGVSDRFSGQAYISAVEHKIEAGDWLTTVTLGLPAAFVSDAAAFGTSATQGLATPIHGLQVGKVEAITQDPEGKLRIKVHLPLITADGASVWARYAQPYASAEAGIQFMPETNDEVLVAFLNADPNAAVVVGSVHNGQAPPPNAADAENNIKGIVTREKLKIEFDDATKSITIATPGGHSLILDDDAQLIKMEDSNGNSIKMDANGIGIHSAGRVLIDAEGIEVVATGDATVSGMNVTCSAVSEFKSTGGTSAEISSGGQTTVWGTMTMIN